MSPVVWVVPINYPLYLGVVKMYINPEYLENLKKRKAAIRKASQLSEDELRSAIKRRRGCSLFAEAIKDIDETYVAVNKCRISKGYSPLKNPLDK